MLVLLDIHHRFFKLFLQFRRIRVIGMSLASLVQFIDRIQTFCFTFDMRFITRIEFRIEFHIITELLNLIRCTSLCFTQGIIHFLGYTFIRIGIFWTYCFLGFGGTLFTRCLRLNTACLFRAELLRCADVFRLWCSLWQIIQTTHFVR